MPTYDYVCSACGHTFECFQSMTDEPLTNCPECDGRVERQIGTGAGFIFKGSGFYITDNRSDSYSKDAKNDKKPAESSTKSTKKESAPAPASKD